MEKAAVLVHVKKNLSILNGINLYLLFLYFLASLKFCPAQFSLYFSTKILNSP